MESKSPTDTDKRSQGDRSRIRLMLGILSIILYITAFFWIAGRIDWIEGWGFIVLMGCGQTLHALYLRRKNPELIKRRSMIGENTKKWDKIWLTLFAILYMVIVFVGALDAGRYGWSHMPGWLWPAGGIIYLASLVFLTWAMAVNPHFEKTVRIQHDRNHRVVDSGPYRIVRHPGYIGVILGFVLPVPLLLGSWWAGIPACVMGGWIVLRTILEDRTLGEELEGYKEYAQRVRYRLIPYVW
jgi:protein-S-isoprenylcysteine O-methyltransferase Ste14